MKRIVDKLLTVITCILMVAMVLVACWQVFTRFVLDSPSTVSEEFLRYSLIWLTMLGSAYAYGAKKHLAVVFVVRRVPLNFQVYINLLVELIMLVFILGILLFGGAVAYRNAQGQISSALGIPIEFTYLSLIVSGVLFLFYAIFHIAGHLAEKKRLIQNSDA